MKTTFKKVFEEFDDELMNIDESNLSDIDFDIEKVKGEVFMRIEDNNNKKRVGKKFTVLLVAAVILLVGTIGAFATGDVQNIFKGLFNKGSNMNTLGLYDGGDVTVSSRDDSLDIKLLGVTGDGEKLFSVLEVTKKDGSEVIDKDYQYFSNNTGHDTMVYITTKSGEHASAFSNARFELSESNKVLKVYIYSFGIEQEVKDGKMNITCSYVTAFKKDRVLASLDQPQSLTEVEEGAENFWFDEDFLEEKRSEFDLSEEECEYFYTGDKREYCQGSYEKFDLPFEIIFDINYSTDNFTEVSLSAETAPNVVETFVEDATMTITPFGVRLSGQYKENSIGTKSDEAECFKAVSNDETSKIVLDDSTVYYLYDLYGSVRETNDKGMVFDNYSLNMNTVPGTHYEIKFIVIDPREVKEVYLNGELVYSK